MPGNSDAHAERRAVLPPGVTLHARPAGALVRQAIRFDAAVEIRADGKRANAKSILEVLALGATVGTELVFAASGKDAAEAVGALCAFVRTLGPREQFADKAEGIVLRACR